MNRELTFIKDENLAEAVKAVNYLNKWWNDNGQEIISLVENGFTIANNTQLDKRTRDALRPILDKLKGKYGGHAWLSMDRHSISLCMRVNVQNSTYTIYLETFVRLDGTFTPKPIYKANSVKADIRRYRKLHTRAEEMERKARAFAHNAYMFQTR